jgi:hypothetical protein
LPPITIPYTIRAPTAEDSTPSEVIYDIPILTDDPLDLFTASLRKNTHLHSQEYIQKLKNIAQIDGDIALLVQGMQADKQRMNFYRAYEEDPIGLMKKWIASQQADIQVVTGDLRGLGNEWHRGGSNSVWGSQAAKQSVSMYLARPKGPAGAAPGAQ